jgi:membrane protein required for beta-lactamase induction
VRLFSQDLIGKLFEYIGDVLKQIIDVHYRFLLVYLFWSLLTGETEKVSDCQALFAEFSG